MKWSELVIDEAFSKHPREALKRLVDQGVQIDRSIDELTDDECREVCWEVYRLASFS